MKGTARHLRGKCRTGLERKDLHPLKGGCKMRTKIKKRDEDWTKTGAYGRRVKPGQWVAALGSRKKARGRQRETFPEGKGGTEPSVNETCWVRKLSKAAIRTEALLSDICTSSSGCQLRKDRIRGLSFDLGEGQHAQGGQTTPGTCRGGDLRRAGVTTVAIFHLLSQGVQNTPRRGKTFLRSLLEAGVTLKWEKSGPFVVRVVWFRESYAEGGEILYGPKDDG